MPTRFLYFFGNDHADGGEELRRLVGGKGASLAEMTRAGLNVPPGFTISTASGSNRSRLSLRTQEVISAGVPFTTDRII